MSDSIQEQIVKNVAAALGSVAAVQRLQQSGVDLAVVPTILVKEGVCAVELAQSTHSHVRRRMELWAVVIVQHDEAADPRSGGEVLNALVAAIELVLVSNRTWEGLAIETEPPSYEEVELDATSPHLARGVRFDVLYEHKRNDPYSQ